MTLTDRILNVIGNQHVLYPDALRDYHVAQAVKRAMRLKVKSHRYIHIGRALRSYRGHRCHARRSDPHLRSRRTSGNLAVVNPSIAVFTAIWSNQMNKLPAIHEVLDSPSASFWLKNALRFALERDCVDAARDAELLSALLSERSNKALGR